MKKQIKSCFHCGRTKEQHEDHDDYSTDAFNCVGFRLDEGYKTSKEIIKEVADAASLRAKEMEISKKRNDEFTVTELARFKELWIAEKQKSAFYERTIRLLEATLKINVNDGWASPPNVRF